MKHSAIHEVGYVITGLFIGGIFQIIPAVSDAATGVSDERVVLPDGPGSIGGIGENADIDPNMGQMSYSVAVEVPKGYDDNMTPSLSLSYSSGAGTSEVGIGWSLSVPYIERMSKRGLPEYDTEDEFAVSGGEELVLIGSNDDGQVYRARFEKSFVRYTWVSPGEGAGGYWTAEYPDGRIGYFGANRNGVEVETARVADADGNVFRYHLVVMVDPFGHRTTYSYVKHGDYSVVDTIGYVYAAGDDPRFSVTFTYETRDDVMSDCVAGFNLLLDQRLSSIQVFSSAEQIRQYVLAYEDYDSSGGASRLMSVTQYGRNDTLHPIKFSFGYSLALGGVCEDDDCETPYMVEMGTLPGGVDISTGKATLLDINGDALPDMLATDDLGVHTFYMNTLDAENKPRFDDTTVESSETVGGSAFILASPGVQVLDVNGDGFTDIISAKTGDVLCNNGSGDWAGTSCMQNSTVDFDMSVDDDDEAEGDPLHIRFMDYDNDKRIDLIRTQEAVTDVYRNTGTTFEQVLVEDIGEIFDESNLQLADMNGDNLQDPVIISTDLVRYRLNLGFGEWSGTSSDWTEVVMEGIDETSAKDAELEDLNGDGLADLVIVLANEVRFAVNRNGASFDELTIITSDDVDGDLPERTSETTVLFADMNGNGSDDVVWVTNNGSVQFLELFPVKPNLLSRIENGIGYVQTINYGASVVEQARDEESNPWKYKLPNAMNVVTGTDTWNNLTGGEAGEGLHETVNYRYHHGYYDGEAKDFRGYEEVESEEPSDPETDGQEGGMTAYIYDVGADDAYYNGLLLQKNLYGLEGDELYPISEERHVYDDCEVSEIPEEGLLFDVRFICETETTKIYQEGAPADEWITTLTEKAYDGYGNVTQTAALGVVSFGPPEDASGCGACNGPDGSFGAPCGSECLGDEYYTETAYVVPGDDTGGRWMLNMPYVENNYGSADDPVTEKVTYYDGEDFVGADLGTLTLGTVSRITEKISDDSDDVVNKDRNAYDEHGNVIETIDPLGDVDDETAHRRRYTYDDLGLKVVKVEILTQDADGNSYVLSREMTYESAFLKPSESTAWMVEGLDGVSSARNSSLYRYDEHGRVVRIIRPGDSNSAPTNEYSYELGDPSSRIVQLSRSVSGEDADIETIICLDGQGRDYQQRTKLADGSYLVTGFTEFNRRGAEVRVYQAYAGDTDACDTTPPNDVLYLSIAYDAANRETVRTYPDSDIYDDASYSTKVYMPLAMFQYDQEDNDSSSPFYDTPTVERYDGLERLVGIDRYLEAGEPPAVLSIFYNGLGQLTAYEDADGNTKLQEPDFLGRVLRVDDPNAGTTTYEYDDAGNLLRAEDAQGNIRVMTYDGVNRRLTLSDGNDDSGDSTVAWTYDASSECDDCINAAGLLARVTYPLGDLGEGIDEFAYDTRGQSYFQARTIEGYRYMVSHTFDNAGRMTEEEQPDGNTIAAVYDPASRVTEIEGVVDSATYDEKGQLSSIVFANGIAESFAYDGLKRLAEQAISNSDDEVLHGNRYTRSRTDNILAVEDTSSERDNRPHWNAEYTYDSWYRVLDAAFDPEGTQEETVSYTYDVIDNILSAESSLGAASPAHIGAYAYDGAQPNAVTTAGDIEMAYDDAGRMSSRSEKELSWDYQGRLVEVSEDGEVTGEFLYGPEEERIAKIEDGGLVLSIFKNFEVRDGIGTTYSRMEGRRVARQENADLAAEVLSDLAPLDDSDGEITAADAWLAYADGEGIADVDGDPSDVDRLLNSAARRGLLQDAFLHTDNLNNIVLATDDDAEILGERAFYLTGETRFEEGYTDECGFTGQQRDESTGLIHFKHRYLDGATGRWVSPDPMFSTVTSDLLKKVGESTTAYAYVAGNFVNNTDPDGLEKNKEGEKPKKKSKKSGKKETSKKEKLQKMKTRARRLKTAAFGASLAATIAATTFNIIAVLAPKDSGLAKGMKVAGLATAGAGSALSSSLNHAAERTKNKYDDLKEESGKKKSKSKKTKKRKKPKAGTLDRLKKQGAVKVLPRRPPPPPPKV